MSPFLQLPSSPGRLPTVIGFPPCQRRSVRATRLPGTKASETEHSGCLPLLLGSLHAAHPCPSPAEQMEKLGCPRVTITRSEDASSHPMNTEGFWQPKKPSRRLITQGSESGTLAPPPFFPSPGVPFSPSAKDTNILLDTLPSPTGEIHHCLLQTSLDRCRTGLTLTALQLRGQGTASHLLAHASMSLPMPRDPSPHAHKVLPRVGRLMVRDTFSL